MQLISLKVGAKYQNLSKCIKRKKGRKENHNDHCSLPYHLIRSIHNIRRKKTITINPPCPVSSGSFTSEKGGRRPIKPSSLSVVSRQVHPGASADFEKSALKPFYPENHSHKWCHWNKCKGSKPHLALPRWCFG